MEMFKALNKPQQTVLVDSLVEERFKKDDDIILQARSKQHSTHFSFSPSHHHTRNCSSLLTTPPLL